MWSEQFSSPAEHIPGGKSQRNTESRCKTSRVLWMEPAGHHTHTSPELLRDADEAGAMPQDDAARTVLRLTSTHTSGDDTHTF